MKLTAYSRLMRDQASKHTHIYDVTMIELTEVTSSLQIFNLGKTTRNYYTPVTYDHVISVNI